MYVKLVSTLNVGVSKPLSIVKGSATKVMDLANSKPLSCMTLPLFRKSSIDELFINNECIANRVII